MDEKHGGSDAASRVRTDTEVEAVEERLLRALKSAETATGLGRRRTARHGMGYEWHGMAFAYAKHARRTAMVGDSSSAANDVKGNETCAMKMRPCSAWRAEHTGALHCGIGLSGISACNTGGALHC